MIEPDERAKIRKNKIQRMLNRPLWLQIEGSLSNLSFHVAEHQ